MKLASLFILSILFIGCGTTHYLTYESKPSPDTYTFYSKGIPITSYNNNKIHLLLTVEETHLLGDDYLRIWLLIQNNSDSVYLLEPYDIIEVTGTIHLDYLTIKPLSDFTSRDIVKSIDYEPQSPTVILDAINAEKNMSMILTSIGGALKSLSTEGTTIKSNTGDIYRINDKEAKRYQVNEQTINELNNTANWYNLFESSISSGVLRKNTIFPHGSINGYVYFPLNDKMKALEWEINNLRHKLDIKSGEYYPHYNIKEFNFKIKLKLNNTVKIIELSPVNVW